MEFHLYHEWRVIESFLHNLLLELLNSKNSIQVPIYYALKLYNRKIINYNNKLFELIQWNGKL